MLNHQTVSYTQHSFVLAKIHPQSQQIILATSFQPIQRLSKYDPRPNNIFHSTTPSFNQDQQYFTPTFILHLDEAFYKLNSQFQKMQFEQLIHTTKQKTIQNNEYRYFPPTNYCQLCKLRFAQYSQHIQSQQHSTQITSSQANPHINELANKFLHQSLDLKKIIKKNRNVSARENKGKAKIVNKSKKGGVKKMMRGQLKDNNQTTNILNNSL